MVNPFLIPLNAIRAIEIVARRGALAPAAEELGVTPGAVSQHIRRAEDRLGIELFDRSERRLVPSETLVQVLPQLSAGFVALEDAMRALKGGEDGVLTLTVGSVFASRWLIWRLGRFTAAHPEVEVRLVVTGKLIDLAHSDIDCAIRFGKGRWPGVKAEAFGPASVSPVCAPALARRLQHPADLAHVPVIQDETTMLSWDDWFAAAGISPPPRTNGASFNDPALAFDAAVTGQGVLLAVDMMSADAVADGRLVRPFPVSQQGDVGYWFVTAEGRREPKKVRLFRDWLRSELPAPGVSGSVGA